MVSLGWSVKDDRNLEVFVGFLMGSPRILTLATMIHDFSLNGKRVSLLKSNDLFMTEISGKRSVSTGRESKLQSFTKTAGMYSLAASPAFPTCWRFWMSSFIAFCTRSDDTTAAGAGLWHERPSATGNGSRQMFVDVGQATHWGCLEQQRTICCFNWLHPSYDLSPRREKAGLRGVCHVCLPSFYVCPTSKI